MKFCQNLHFENSFSVASVDMEPQFMKEKSKVSGGLFVSSATGRQHTHHNTAAIEFVDNDLTRKRLSRLSRMRKS